MPDATINYTPNGWPYLDDSNFIDLVDSYTVELAAMLDNSEADVAAAINAANAAQAAAAIVTGAAAQLARLSYATAAGEFSAGQKTGASYTHRVTFPAGRFTVAPIVGAQVDNSAAGTAPLQISIGARTPTYCDLVFWLASGNLNNTWCTATWTATQMTASSAAG